MVDTNTWATALRSGNYPQIPGYMYLSPGDDDPTMEPGFCCLGVRAALEGCSLAKLDGIESPAELGQRFDETADEILAAANDGGWSFGRIADALTDKAVARELLDWYRKKCVKTTLVNASVNRAIADFEDKYC